MYAIIQIGSKQYRVQKDDVIDVDLLEGEPGSKIQFDMVLFHDNGSKVSLGAPSIGGCKVVGELVGKVPGLKIDTIKYKPSRNQYRRFGHRQHYSRVKIMDIVSPKENKHGS